MANAILTPELTRQNEKYALNEADRQAIFATFPPKIQYQGGTIPPQKMAYIEKLRQAHVQKFGHEFG